MNLGGRTDKLRENLGALKKDTETIRKTHSEIKATLTEMKNNLQGINSRVYEAKNQISNLEYKEAKNTQSEQQEKKRIQKMRSIWGNFKFSNICIMRVPE